MQACITPPRPPAVDLDVPVTAEPAEVCLPQRAMASAPSGAGVLDGLQFVAQRLACAPQSSPVAPKPKAQTARRVARAAGRAAGTATRKARRVFERTGEVFD